MINALVTDLTRQTRANIEAARPASIDEVRAAAALAAFSEPLRAEQQALKAFLRHNLYRHYRVVRMTFKSQRIVRELFAAFLSERRLLPPEFQRRGEHDLPRAIADYIAGMTDRYAIREHRRLFLVDDGSGN